MFRIIDISNGSIYHGGRGVYESREGGEEARMSENKSSLILNYIH